MATSNFAVTGTSAATATSISGLTDGNDYEIQNRLDGVLYLVTAASQPDGSLTPKSVGRGASFYVSKTSTEDVYVWRDARYNVGNLVIEDLGTSN